MASDPTPREVLAALPEALRPTPDGATKGAWVRAVRRLARRLGGAWGTLSLEEKRAAYAVALRLLQRSHLARARTAAPLLGRLRPAGLGLDAALVVLARAILARVEGDDPATRRALHGDDDPT